MKLKRVSGTRGSSQIRMDLTDLADGTPSSCFPALGPPAGSVCEVHTDLARSASSRYPIKTVSVRQWNSIQWNVRLSQVFNYRATFPAIPASSQLLNEIALKCVEINFRAKYEVIIFLWTSDKTVIRTQQMFEGNSLGWGPMWSGDKLQGML